MITPSIVREYYEKEFFEFEYGRKSEIDIWARSRLRLFSRILSENNIEGSWIDVGCGFGNALEMLINRTASMCVGIDISMRCLEEVKKKNLSNCLLRQADASLLPFEDCSFTGVVGLELIEHTIDWRQTVYELTRISNRWLILSFPTDYDWLYTKLGIYKNPYIDISLEEALCNHVGHISVPKLNDVISLLNRRKFTVQNIYGLYSVIPPLFKFGVKYEDLNRLSQLLFCGVVQIDHWLGKYPPFKKLGLNTLIVATRM